MNYVKDKEAIEAFLLEEWEEYGHRFDVDKDEEAEDYEYFTITPSEDNPKHVNEFLNHVNIRVKELDEDNPSSSKFEIEISEDYWHEVVHYDWTIKYFYIALMWWNV